MAEQGTPLYLQVAEWLRQRNKDMPMSYLEFREADYKLSKERREVVKVIGARIRNLCRAEIDDYVNCYNDSTYSVFECKNEANIMKQCVRSHQEELVTPESIQKVMEERLRTGDSFVVPSYIKKASEAQVCHPQTGKEEQKRC